MSDILLIEPNTLLATTYMQALQNAGHSVVHCYGAQAAILAADAKVPHVVVMELQLAAHNGIEFLHEFRSYPEWQAIPVIINTMVPPARLSGVEEALMRDLGVIHVAYKPRLSLQELLGLVREHAQ